MTDSLDGALALLAAESRDLLGAMEKALLAAEAGQIDGDGVNAMFRAAHSIKGSAGLFGLQEIVDFTGLVEDVLDQVREGQLAIDKAMIELMLACCDHMGVLVQGAVRKESPDAGIVATGAALARRLRTYAGGAESAEEQDAVAPEPPATRWHLSLRLTPEALRNGMDPASFIRFLGTLGTLEELHTVTSAIPRFAEFDPERLYLGLEISLSTAAPREQIENVFEFVRNGSRITILDADCGAGPCEQLLGSLAGQAPLVRAMLGRSGHLRELAAPSEPAQRAASPDINYVRVDARKLDSLINLVGELVLADAAAGVVIGGLGNSQARDALAHLSRYVTRIRDGALGLRMVPIGATFQRFQRIVRDVAHELGKSIELELAGAETELDRGMVEKLNEPLLHLVRNAIDHGIESMTRRVELGKPAKGHLQLAARQEAGNIVIEVSEDGAGLDIERIRQRAIERGLIAGDANPSRDELQMLIFEPGFSTAARVSEISGRGVGLDVVKRNVEDLRGHIELDSEPGQGTTVRLSLPLTLAIIDGLQVAIAGRDFVLPMARVDECLDFASLEPDRARQVVTVRGQLLPWISLRELFRLGDGAHGREKLVVVYHGRARIGLVVDDLRGELQAVVKPIGQLFRTLRCVSGSTILANGQLALILDVPTLVTQAGRHELADGVSKESVK